MNGAESLLRTAAAAGVNVCFANPGTTEMPLVAAFDAVPGTRAILGLFEGVCTGAADGYGRMTGRPALTLLHLGPGFANGIANLHNARRARSPIVNLIGDMATWHLAADAPLTSDIVSLASPVSAWLRTSKTAEEVAGDTAEAIAAAMQGQIATLIIPHDCQLDPSSGPVRVRSPERATRISDEAVDRAAGLLRRNEPAALLLGGGALRDRGLRAAGRLAAASNCVLLCETFPARLERGPTLPRLERLPYFPEQALAVLSKYKNIVVAGAKEPVSFFGYPGIPSRLLTSDQKVEMLAAPEVDVEAALEALADELRTPPSAMDIGTVQRAQRPTGPLNLETFAAAIASVQPEGAIIMDEGNTSSAAYYALSSSAPQHTLLTLTGGAIGQGLPCATGAAVACADRKVIAIQADGSGMYTLQALWTQAREGLDVTTVVCSNRSYRVLGVELARSGIKEPGPQSRSLIGLSNPPLDWVQLAAGMGVPGVRVDTADGLSIQLERSLAQPGPKLIEVML